MVGPLFTSSLTWSEIDHVEPVLTRAHTYHLRRTYPEPPRRAPTSVHRAYRAIASRLP